MSFLPPNHQVSKLGENTTYRTINPNQWLGIVFPSSITRLPKEGTLLRLQRLFDASTQNKH